MRWTPDFTSPISPLSSVEVAIPRHLTCTQSFNETVYYESDVVWQQTRVTLSVATSDDAPSVGSAAQALLDVMPALGVVV